MAEVPLGLTVATLPARSAVALVVVGQLDALLGAHRGTGVGQTFVDISLATGPDETSSAPALVPSNLVHTGAPVVTSSFEALIDIDLTEKTHGAVGTGTPEVIDQVVTDAIVLAGLGVAIINIELAVLALETRGTDALVGSDEVFAGGSIPAGLGQTLIDLILAV